MSLPGGGEMILIFLVILLLFGAKRIPEIARGLGKGIREFKDATNDLKREITVEPTQIPAQAPGAPPTYAQPTVHTAQAGSPAGATVPPPAAPPNAALSVADAPDGEAPRAL